MALFSLIIYLYIMLTAIITIFVVLFPVAYRRSRSWPAICEGRCYFRKSMICSISPLAVHRLRVFLWRAERSSSATVASASGTPEGPRRKIFSRDEGEYIDFEEVTVRTGDPASSEASATGKRAYTPREPQITDAEWEGGVEFKLKVKFRE